jgi:hypothetical protein
MKSHQTLSGGERYVFTRPGLAPYSYYLISRTKTTSLVNYMMSKSVDQ